MGESIKLSKQEQESIKTMYTGSYDDPKLSNPIKHKTYSDDLSEHSYKFVTLLISIGIACILLQNHKFREPELRIIAM